MKNLIVLSLTLLILTLAPVLTLNAQGLCDFVPCTDYAGFCEGGDCPDALNSTTGLIRYGLTAVFAVIIMIGVVFIIRGALKIIQSEGDTSKMQEGYQNIQGVMFGVVILFVGIIGVVIISALFGAQNVFTQSPELPINPTTL